ncbi:MAG: macro domain-containing protein [Thermomicrobiales bacterium]|nr:macro domain-containing protein [Thermomicrobiales bacterium]
MIEVKIGDLLESQAQTLVNTVNCVGVMGKGIALSFREQFPEMYKDYADRCARGEVRLGEPYLVRQLMGPWVLNFPTKDHWRSVSRIEDIEAGLEFLERHYQEWGIASIAVPPLGCGNGKLEWREVGPLIYRSLKRMEIPAQLFAPLGTPEYELDPAFLNGSMIPFSVGHSAADLAATQPGWFALVEIVKRLSDQPYHWPIGRTVFQKIAYVATAMGIPTQLRFRRNSYGPFSEDSKNMLSRLVNSQLMAEQPDGVRLRITIGAGYESGKQRAAEKIAEWDRTIDRIVDLFMRVRTADDAEIVATVMFVTDELSAAQDSVSELDVLESVQDWKKRRRIPLDPAVVAETIRSLAAQQWIKVVPSEELPIADPFELVVHAR